MPETIAFVAGLQYVAVVRQPIQQGRERGIRKPETFDFLGFTHCCSTLRSNREFKIVRRTIKKRVRATLATLRETLVRRRHEPVRVTGRWLRRVLQGYLNHHAVPDNMRRLAGFLKEVGRAWRHALLRRSQRRRMPWSRLASVCRRADSSIHIRLRGFRSTLLARAVCSGSARTDLCGSDG
jgi:hypothetical protein